MWKSFIEGFCKVEMLCYQGVPNWLGWVNIGILTLVLGGGVLMILFSFIEQDAAERKLKLNK